MVIKYLVLATRSVEHLPTMYQFFLSPVVDPLDPHNVEIFSISSYLSDVRLWDTGQWEAMSDSIWLISLLVNSSGISI